MFTFFLFLTGVSEAKEVSYLQYRNDVSYEVNSETPYTGKLVELHWNGKKKREATYKNGKLDGLHTSWYLNGQKKDEETHKNGKLTGWYENGQKKREATHKNDKLDGLMTRWYENGQKKDETNWKDGKKEGLWTVWDENGQKKNEINWKGGKKEALLAEQNKQATITATAAIQQKVIGRWIKPVSSVKGMSCTVRVKLLPSGDVMDAVVVASSGDSVFDRSAENAVRKASPLPVPASRALFAKYFKEFTFRFKPEK